MSTVSHPHDPTVGVPRLPALAAGLLTAGAAAVASLSVQGSGDYQAHGAVSGDNAGPSLLALAHGQLGTLASHQPLMGLSSLIVRAPFLALGSAIGASGLTGYRLGVLACLLPCALFLAWVIAERSSPGLTAGATLAAALVLLSPVSGNALSSGHPEELLTAVAVVAATLAAMRGRSASAGVLLGLAIGTKEWGVIGVLPVLIAVPDRRRLVCVVTGATALLLLAPPVLANPHAFAAASRSLGDTHLVNAISGWWPVSSRPADIPAGAPLVGVLPGSLDKSSALAIGFVASVAIAMGLWRVAAARGVRTDPLALLALLALLRCLIDPGPVEYYYAPLVIVLAIWEAAVLERLPIVAVCTLAAVSLTFRAAGHLGAGELNALSLGWAAILGGYLASRIVRARHSVDPAAPALAQAPSCAADNA
jgi:Glycosyltransferase family 87